MRGRTCCYWRFLCFRGDFEKNIARAVEGPEGVLVYVFVARLCVAFGQASRAFREL